MRDLTIRNTKLIETLNRFSTFVFSNYDKIKQREFNVGRTDKNGVLKEWTEVCSDDYLHHRMKSPPEKTGFPTYMYGVGTDRTEITKAIPGMKEENNILDDGIMEAIGMQFCALKVVYPENGYIDWHNNCNCPGQNLIMSYSQDGDGWFKYLDPKTNQIVTMEDKPGWNAKVGYYGAIEEPDKILWHCAKTAKPRITVSYVIRDQDMWEELVNDIESEY